MWFRAFLLLSVALASLLPRDTWARDDGVPLKRRQMDTTSPPYDPSAPVRHLQTVHLILTIVCVVVLLALFGRSGELQDAERQLANIGDILDGWNEKFLSAEKLTSHPDLRLNKDILPENTVVQTEEGAVAARPVTLATLSSQGKPCGNLDLNGNFIHCDIVTGDIVISKPTAVADVREVWNALHAIIPVHVVERLSDSAWIQTPATENEWVEADVEADDIKETNEDNSTVIVDVHLTPDQSDMDDVPGTSHILYGRQGGYAIKIPAETREWRIYGQDMLLQDHDKVGTATGPFGEVFGALIDVRAQYGDRDLALQPVDFKQFRSKLIEEAVRSDAEMSFAGLKVKTGNVVLMTVLIIPILQGYFYLQCSHLRRIWSRASGHSCQTIAWIGLFPDWKAFAATTASMCALPPAVLVLALVILRWPLLEFWDKLAALLLTAAAVSVMLAGLSYRQLRGLRASG